MRPMTIAPPRASSFFELKSADELKLVEAIHIAYTEALLSKMATTTDTEKSREEKIKQMAENLQELLRKMPT